MCVYLCSACLYFLFAPISFNFFKVAILNSVSDRKSRSPMHIGVLHGFWISGFQCMGFGYLGSQICSVVIPEGSSCHLKFPLFALEASNVGGGAFTHCGCSPTIIPGVH